MWRVSMERGTLDTHPGERSLGSAAQPAPPEPGESPEPPSLRLRGAQLHPHLTPAFRTETAACASQPPLCACRAAWARHTLTPNWVSA